MHPLVEYLRCPEHMAAVLETAPGMAPERGYFSFGEAIGYGRVKARFLSRRPNVAPPDISQDVSFTRSRAILPFDLREALDNLRHERYPEAAAAACDLASFSVAHALYYFVRPALPVVVRRHIQRLRLTGWAKIPFPQWPVDTTVEALVKGTVRLLLEVTGVKELPFVWFWPDGAPAAAIMTHDVEGPGGASFCDQLMDLDDRFGVKSSFQIIPDAPRAARSATRELVERLRQRNFEVNIHDLAHDGQLFRDASVFRERATRINEWAREYGCRGFRAGAMYRRQDWLGSLDFSYDMSVPNVAHLEPQRGGCCTVMPFFIGDLVELPLTATQDYSLLHVLSDYSTALWQRQINLVLEQHGLISFIAHPDYLLDPRARDVYRELLGLLARLREERNVWVTPPGEMNDWWRQRREMRLVPDGDSWRIEGDGSERARLAFARLDADRVVYSVAPASVPAKHR